jgi:hypothetical protein
MSTVKGRSLVAILCVAAFASAATSGQPSPPLPNRADSLKFAAIGDNGTGDRPQFEVAQQMDKVRATFPFELVIMLGDNMYGGQQPADFIKKFQEPYARLLAAGVTFYASLGNHDRPENVSYKPFNMNGARYYTYARKNVRFFVLDTTQMDAKQVAWIDAALQDAKEDWKICYFHHPLYSKRGSSWFLGRLTRDPGAHLRQARRQCRVLRARPCLRATEASERDFLLRIRSGGTTSTRQYEAD